MNNLTKQNLNQLNVRHVLDGADPELFGDLHIARVHESAELGAVQLEEAEHLLVVEVHRVAQIERNERRQLAVFDERLEHLHKTKNKHNIFNTFTLHINKFKVNDIHIVFIHCP